jgi:hypothetical protein
VLRPYKALLLCEAMHCIESGEYLVAGGDEGVWAAGHIGCAGGGRCVDNGGLVAAL